MAYVVPVEHDAHAIGLLWPLATLATHLLVLLRGISVNDLKCSFQC